MNWLSRIMIEFDLLNINDIMRRGNIMRSKIRYSCNQKDWFRNIDNIVVNYRHRGEANDMYLVHMSCPKSQIDRLGFYPKNWRWK